MTAAAALILVSASACSGHAGPPPRSPGITRTSSAPADLSHVLIQPTGFGPVPNDTTSGPLRTPDDVRRFFTDRPADPAEILSHGFAGGYVQEWQVPQKLSASGSTVVVAPSSSRSCSSSTPPPTPSPVERYFRHTPPLWPVTSFAVPSPLASGYGQYQVQGSGATATYLYAVVWMSRNRLFEAGMDYSAPQKSPAQVISVALAQSRASP